MSKFVWEQDERVWPAWLFVGCPTCGNRMKVEPDPQTSCIPCRIKQKAAAGFKPRQEDEQT